MSDDEIDFEFARRVETQARAILRGRLINGDREHQNAYSLAVADKAEAMFGIGNNVTRDIIEERHIEFSDEPNERMAQFSEVVTEAIARQERRVSISPELLPDFVEIAEELRLTPPVTWHPFETMPAGRWVMVVRDDAKEDEPGGVPTSAIKGVVGKHHWLNNTQNDLLAFRPTHWAELPCKPVSIPTAEIIPFKIIDPSRT